MKKEEKLSIIVPCYNEEQIIYNNLLILSNIIKKFWDNYEIICVNDGSKDNTYKEIKKATKKDKKIELVSYDNNQGKGYALKTGTLKAKGDIICFIDCDLELSPTYIEKYINLMYENNADIVVGSKMHKESIIKYPLIRKILSLGYYIILKLLFNLKIKDTQTGLKVFKADKIKFIIKDIFTTGFAFDIEILAMASKLNYKIIDAPIELNFTREHGMSRIKIKDIIKMFNDTIKIFYKISIKKSYIQKRKEEVK